MKCFEREGKSEIQLTIRWKRNVRCESVRSDNCEESDVRVVLANKGEKKRSVYITLPQSANAVVTIRINIMQRNIDRNT